LWVGLYQALPFCVLFALCLGDFDGAF